MLQSNDADAFKSSQGNVLVTSISKKVPMLKAVRYALNRWNNNGHLYGGDVNEACIGRYFVDHFWHMPRLSELTAGSLIEYCLEHGIKAIIPSRDGELSFFADCRDLLQEQGIQVMVSSPAAVRPTLDKLEFYHVLAKRGFPVIPTVLHMEELQNYQSFVVKERYGAGANQIGLKLGHSEAYAHAAGLKHPVIQPFVTGKEYSVDVYVDRKGVAKGTVARTRDLVVSGESQITTTVKHPQLETLCSALVEVLGLYGHAVIQAIEDDSGNLHLIECNGRFGGASVLGLEAGLDSFYWFLQECEGAGLEEMPFIRKEQELRLVRFAEDKIICL